VDERLRVAPDSAEGAPPTLQRRTSRGNQAGEPAIIRDQSGGALERAAQER